MNNAQICVTCVMDTSDSQIVFNEKGVCDHFETYYSKIKPAWDSASKQDLGALASKIKSDGKNRDFDCIVGMSGGIDSSYLIYLVVKKLGLRPLVFHVDAGWNSQEAVNNIERIVDGLKLDLFTEVINWEEMRDLQLSFFRSGVPHIDTPQDHAFFATMYKFAEEHGVKYILTGANYATECIRNPLEWMWYQSDSTQLKDIHSRFGSIPFTSFPITSILRHKVYLPYVRGIKVIRPLNYFRYNKEEAMRTLQSEFGWQPYPQKHFESRFTRFYEGYWLPERFGFDTRKVQFSSLILTGQMTRDEALEQLSRPALDGEMVKNEFDYVAKKLDISPDELQQCFDLPKKTYRDYKSQRHLYNVGAFAMRLLGLELGGKR